MSDDHDRPADDPDGPDDRDPETAAAGFARWLVGAAEYADPERYETRSGFTRRVETADPGWYRWLFDRFDLPPDARVLDVGCGLGTLLTANADRVPSGWTLTLTDSSTAMLDAARDRVPARSTGPVSGSSSRRRPPGHCPSPTDGSTPSSPPTCCITSRTPTPRSEN